MVGLLAACSGTGPEDSGPAGADGAGSAGYRTAGETWPFVEDPADLQRIGELRDGWIDAFAASDASRLAFVFERDAVFADLEQMVGEDASRSGDALFDNFDAELSVSRERPVSYGDWVSYQADYTLSLRPKEGGLAIEDSGRFMAFLQRGDDGRLALVTGPRIGDVAPDFSLETTDGARSIRLSDLRDKPTVLVFGSFT